MTKMYHQSSLTFTGNEITFSFFRKRRFQGFISEILRVVGLSGEKFTFSAPLRQPKFPGVSNLLCSGTGDPFAICKPAISDCWNDYHLKREYDVPSSQSEVQSQSQDTEV